LATILESSNTAGVSVDVKMCGVIYDVHSEDHPKEEFPPQKAKMQQSIEYSSSFDWI
jgi:hypothetical protein